jgi:bifunctional DNA-binding transcriptional regulator/antitoxin component of YhaV-PrlF toxin-antitoxin module
MKDIDMADFARMKDLTSGISTVSGRIRALHAAGFSRSDIAKFLGKRYQHVRNVLVQDAMVHKQQTEGKKAYSETLPERLDLQLGPGGRVVIPAVYRQAMGVQEGGRLMARVVDGELRLITPAIAIRRAQRIVRETIPAHVSLVDDLIEERRQEFEREMSDD